MYVFPWKLVVTEDGIIISDPSYTTKSQAGLAKIKNLKTWKYNVWEISKEDTNEYWLFHESLSEEDLKNEEELTNIDIYWPNSYWSNPWMLWFFDAAIFPKTQWSKYSEAFCERCHRDQGFVFAYHNDDFFQEFKAFVINTWNCSIHIKWIQNKWQYVALHISYS